MPTRRDALALLVATVMGAGGKAASARMRIEPFEASPFPYDGPVPDSDGKPFLDTMQGDQRAHTSSRGGVYPESPTYTDRSVLLALSPRLEASRGVLVVYLHGNLARLDRDVVRRQQVVAQVAASHLDTALVAPQFALDALDSSAGHFWEEGFFARFLAEARQRLAAFSRQPVATIAAMPVVLVAYSGGYNPAAAILARGGAPVAGVILLDALYGEEQTFADWIVRSNKHAFFFSAFSTSSAPGNLALQADLRARGIACSDGLPPQLVPGTVAFEPAGAVAHNDFVTQAWTAEPLRVVLGRVRLVNRDDSGSR